MTESILPAWEDAIATFERSELAAGLSADTVRIRQYRLRRLASGISESPWTMTPQDVQSVIDAIDAGADKPASKKASRIALRAFYRWAHEVGHTTDSLAPVPIPSRRIYTADARWRDAVELFGTAMRSTGHTSSTVELRTKHVARFAVAMTIGPWDVSHEHISHWLEGLPGGDGTRLAHRVSVRAFYRWAHKSGRVDMDPSAEPSRRATQLEAPEAWIPELRAWRSYLRAVGRPETTIGAMQSNVRRFARENASLAPYDVTLDDMIDWLAGRHWSPEYRRANRSALRGFYAWAVDSERIAKNPALKIPIIKAGQPRPRPARDNEYDHALSRANDRERLALRLAAELGLRRGEVVLIHSRDLSEIDQRWSLTVHGKGNKERTIPVPDEMARRIRTEAPGYLFPGGDDGHLSPRTMGKLISRLLPTGVTMHALRHRFATRAYAISGDVLAVQQLLGHSSPATTVRYVKVADDNLRSLVEAVR